MKTLFYLIIVSATNNGVAYIPFGSEKSCEEARVKMERSFAYGFSSRVTGTCVSSGL